MIKPDPKKASKQFINYLKDTQNMPLSQTQAPKTKQSQTENPNPAKKYYGPIQGDFSKIGYTYILQNDRLIKKTPYGRPKVQQDHNQISEQKIQIQEVELIKQIAKLEYLEKKGYLKPQQVQRLQKLRGEPLNYHKAIIENQPKKNQKYLSPDTKLKFMPQNQYIDENIDPNIYYQEYLSPKKQISSMKSLPQQNYKPSNGYESYQFQTPENLYHSNYNYGNQNYLSNQSYY